VRKRNGAEAQEWTRAHKRGFPDADVSAVAIGTPMTQEPSAMGRARLDGEPGHEVSGPAWVQSNARLESRTNIDDGDSHLRSAYLFRSASPTREAQVPEGR
jgi:hypothetical protein